jgi:hypothetical protein
MHGTANPFDGLLNVRIMLTPVVGEPASDPTQSGFTSPRAVEALTVGVSQKALRVETDDAHALALDGLSVNGDFGDSERLVRMVGRVELLVWNPAPYVLAVWPLEELQEIQRRSWVRAAVIVPVTIEIPTSAAGESACRRGTNVTTETVDLSAGGARIVSVPGLRADMHVNIWVTLDQKEEEIEADILEVRPDGLTRLAFRGVNEGASTRITKYVFDAMMARRRSGHRSPD